MTRHSWFVLLVVIAGAVFLGSYVLSWVLHPMFMLLLHATIGAVAEYHHISRAKHQIEDRIRS